MTQKITVFFGIAVMAAVLFGGLTFAQSAFAGENEKVTICHVDQETGEEKTISVGAPSVPAHLENHVGDHEGECVDKPEPTCEECFIEVGEAFSACDFDDYDCQLAAFNAFGECSLSCQGDFDEIPQQCYNDAAPILAECSDASVDGLDACFIDWQDTIISCAFPI